MIRLVSTNDKVQIVLGGAITTNQLQVVTCYSDKTTSGYSGGSTRINTNSTTDVDIVGAPASSTIRDVDFINVYQRDTVAAVVTIKIDVSGTEHILGKWTLEAGDVLTYTHGEGWKVVGSDGSIQVTTGSGSSSESFKTISVSGQSDVVADSSTDTLTLAAGANITITTDAGTDTITIASSGGGSGSTDGWISDSNTWTYASADSPTFTLTVNADLTAVIGVGNRIKLTQTTPKYFIVTAISYSAPNTTITIYGGTDYTLANAAITSPYYSHAKGPIGFPLSPIKWTVTVTDTQDKEKTTPTVNVWYGGANAWSTGSNVSISVPIGTWRMGFSLYQFVLDTSATIVTMESTLSSSDSSESDVELTASIGGNGASSTMTVRQTSRAEKVITVASKTPYYLMARTETVNMDSINWANSTRSAVITAECALL